MKKFFSHHNVFFRNLLSSFLLSPSSLAGQSLIEILIAVAIGALLVIAAAGIIAPALRVNTQTGQSQVGASLGKELLDNLRVWSEGDWHNIGNLSTTSVNTYYLVTAQSPFTSASGTESVTVSTTTYTRYFYVDDVYRDVSGNITASGGTIDPSTKKITVAYTWPNQSATSTVSVYVTRYRNNIYDQTDWSGGANQSGPATTTNNRFSTSTNINYSSTTGSISLSLASATPVTLGSWSATQAVPLLCGGYGQTSVAYNSYLYFIGGVQNNCSGQAASSSIYFASINSTGSVNAWALNPVPLPTSTYMHSSALYNGYVYVLGGIPTTGNATSAVYFVQPNSTGSLGAWSRTTSLPVNEYYKQASVAYNGYLYVIGGVAGDASVFAPTSTVLFAPINSTGSIGSWSSTTPLPTSTFYHTAVVNNSYLYVIAGMTGPESGGVTTSTVYFAPINSTGSVGAWSTTTALPVGLSQHGSVVRSNYLYVIAGRPVTNPTVTSTVMYAAINSTGSVGTWTTTTKLPSAIYSIPRLESVVYNSYLYTVAGFNVSGVTTSTVFFAPFQ